MKAKKVVKNSDFRKSRKQIRKEKRQEKKAKRNEYYVNRNKHNSNVNEEAPAVGKVEKIKLKKQMDKNHKEPILDQKTQNLVEKEKREQQKLLKQMQKQRSKQLKDANIEEDKNIKRLEKQLKLNKRKSKSVPKSFETDGLDYLLEVCDSEKMASIVSAEQQFTEIDDGFEEDFALMTNQKLENSDEFEDTLNEDDTNEESLEEDNFNSDDSDDEIKSKKVVMKPSQKLSKQKGWKADNDSSESEYEDESLIKMNSKKTISSKNKNEDKIFNEKLSKNKGAKLEPRKRRPISSENESDDSNNEFPIEMSSKKRPKIDKLIDNDSKLSKNKNMKSKTKNKVKEKLYSSEEENSEEYNLSDEENLEHEADTDKNSESSFNEGVTDKGAKINKKSDRTWEDIYGRSRDADGNIINNTEGKYIPPAIRAKLESALPEDRKRIEKINKLKRQLKGLLNRLAESNMHSISNQVEELYMLNSRNDMNDTLTNLILESLASNVKTPERLLLEHILLLTILQANIGTEVGAHFLQTVVKRFDKLFNSEDLLIEDKSLDNIVDILAQLYNFKVFHSNLLYQILTKLSTKFEEKQVECILSILRNVGFTLRKDDPLALKDLILDLQKKASNAKDDMKDNPRVKFMLEILLAVKNNNMNKIPNYDTTYSEHLKKIMKSFIRKGNYVTQLNIALDDLLKADERGKWWIVGSAWTGKTEENQPTLKTKSDGFSQKLLELAKKQRMNTDTRRNIFCIIMSAEDYLDAFEKLLHLGLKSQQEREIIHVLLHCCLQEKKYNPYYSVLAQKFCDYDRKFQMTIKYSIWDKLKTLTDCSAVQISNLAKLLTHLFLEKGLPISTLKIVQFSDLDKVTLRFMRQILLGIFLSEDLEQCQTVFDKVAQSEKLKMFRESLRLFIHHFLLRNIDSVPEEQKELLEERAKIIEKILTVNEKRTRF